MANQLADSGIRRLVQNGLFNLVQQLWTLGVGIATSVLVARGLGVEDRGEYAIILLFINLVFTFFNSGLEPAIVYFTAKNQEAFLGTLRTSITLTVWASVFAVLISLLLIIVGRTVLFPQLHEQSLWIPILILPCILFANSLQVVFRGLEDFRTFNIIEMIAQLTLMGMTFVFVWGLQFGIIGAFAALAIRYIFTIALTGFLLRKKTKNKSLMTLSINGSTLREFLSYGARAYGFYIVAFLNQRLDVVLLNLLLVSKSSIALYDVAVGIGEKLWLVSRSASLVIFSRIAAIDSGDQSRNVITPIVARHILWLSILAATGVYIVADWGIQFLYGVEYALSASALKLLLPGLVMLGVGQIVSNDLAGRGRPETVAKQSLIGVMINIVVNLVLIPRLNFIGASMASSISYTAMTLLYFHTFQYVTGTRWRDLVLPTSDDIQLWLRGWKWLRAKLQPNHT